MGRAIDYALGQWPTLEVYLDDGRVELDNNLVENDIRPTAIGKKNWLFIGNAHAGQRSASFTPSSKTGGVAVLTHSLIFVKSSHACPT